MRLTIVGSGPTFTSKPGNPSSSYLVEHLTTSILLDLGQGSFAELWRHGSFKDVAAVAISHMHADHNVDLIPLRHWVRYRNKGYGPALFAPPDLRRRMGDYQADPDFLADLNGASLHSGTFAVGDLLIEAGRVTHIPDSFAFRISVAGADGPGLVYSGDCSVADDLLPLIRPGDTLLSEAAFGSGAADSPMHLTAGQAASAAQRGGARRLVLTHILDGRDPDAALSAASKVFANESLLAEPGLRVEIG